MAEDEGDAMTGEGPLQGVSAPAVSVLVPTRGRAHSLERLLHSLARQTLAARSYEVIVSIDGADPATEEMLRALRQPYPLVIAQGELHLGRAGACNRGLGRAGGAVVVILDDDMEASPQLLERHRGHHVNHDRACVMGAVPVELGSAGTHAARYVRERFETHMRNLGQPGHEFVPRDFYSGNASIRTEVLRGVGGFDEDFAVYGNEDVELFVRLADAGVEFRFDAAASARQSYGKDFAALVRDTRAKGSTTVLVARKHPQRFEQLRLSNPWDGSRPWLAARAILLSFARRWHSGVGGVMRVTCLLESCGLWRASLFYRAALDFAFWIGVQEALAPPPSVPSLSDLQCQLHRGPLDLLLHG